MIALSFLPPPALAQLRRALPAPHHVRPAPTWEALVEQLPSRRWDLVIVDPCTGRERDSTHRLHTLGPALAGAPGTPLIGYVSVTAAAIHAVQALVRLGAAEIVVRGVDDGVEALAATVQRCSAASLAERLVGSLGEPFAALPGEIAAALGLLFRRPERFPSVSDLAAAAGTTRRSLDRWLVRAGLAPARTLLSCARANAAFHLIAAGRLRTGRAAALLGYASPRALSRDLQSLTGYAPSALPRRVSSDTFIATLAPRLLRAHGHAMTAPSY